MIFLQFNVRNPYSSKFENIKCWHGNTPFKHKAWEFQLMKTADLADFALQITHRQSHAGIRLSFGLFGYNAEFNFYDSRHWDDDTGSWCVYND